MREMRRRFLRWWFDLVSDALGLLHDALDLEQRSANFSYRAADFDPPPE